MSILTLHFLEGLSGNADQDGDNSITSTELAEYLTAHVDKSARILDRQPQQPEVIGEKQVLVTYH